LALSSPGLPFRLLKLAYDRTGGFTVVDKCLSWWLACLRVFLPALL
jgi:hypothetical protein